jgi:hypothetical protein
MAMCRVMFGLPSVDEPITFYAYMCGQVSKPITILCMFGQIFKPIIFLYMFCKVHNSEKKMMHTTYGKYGSGV